MTVWATPDPYLLRRRAQWRAARQRYYERHRSPPALKDTPQNKAARKYERKRYWAMKGEGQA